MRQKQLPGGHQAQEKRPGRPGQGPISLALLGPAQPLIPGPKAWEPAKGCPSRAKPFLKWRGTRRRPRPREGKRLAADLIRFDIG